MTTGWRRLLAVGILAGTLGTSLAGAGASTASAEPQAVVSPAIQTTITEVVVGEPIPVSLTGWPSDVVSVALCGERAAAGTEDCANAESTLIVVGHDGAGNGSLRGVLPPTGCPCVLRAKALTGPHIATLPIVVPAAPDSTARQTPTAATVPQSRLVVASSVSDLGDWLDRLLAALGASTEYRLTVTAQNTGSTASSARTADIVLGRDTLGGESIASVSLPPIEPGELVTREIDLCIGAPLAGTYVLHGELDPADNGSRFAAEVTSWPAATLGAAVFLVSWMALALRARRRRPAGIDRHARSRAVPLLRAVAVTAVVSIIATGAQWGITRLLQHWQTSQAQSALLADFVPSTVLAPLDAQQVVREPAATDVPATGALIGVLRIPSLNGLELAVVAGVTPDQLARGPGHYPGTSLPGELGNVVIAGHNSRTHAGAPFVDLERIAVGDSIAVETSAGVWTYTVTGSRVVPPTAVSVLLPVRDDPHATPITSQLTLITCDFGGDATNRLIIEAEIVGPERLAT